MQNNQNFILAIVLSILVLIGWQYFIAQPQVEKARKAQEAAQATKPPTPAAPSAGAPLEIPGAPGSPTAPAAGPADGGIAASREAALAASPRIAIETGRVTGSIALKGGRIDDLHLVDFHETVDPKSPTIVLLSPSGMADAYFGEFGWVAERAAVPGSDTLWTAPPGAKLTADQPITLTYNNGQGLVFNRTIAIDGNYMFTVTDTVQNRGTDPVTLYPYGRVRRGGEPKTAGFFILHEGPIGVFGNSLEEISYGDIKEEPKSTLENPNADAGWLGFTDKYWAVALVPEQGKQFTSRFAHFSVGAYQADFRGDAVTAAAGENATVTNRLFAGAKQVALLNGYRDDLGISRFDLLIDWGWFYFITKPMFIALDWLYRVFGNFGIAILLVTAAIKLFFFPLANKSYRSMSAMKKLQPEMQQIRERFGDDKMKQQQALMELYKKSKINPVAGCWPMLIQVPVFFALYKVLFTTIEMRHAPFFGWIQDLSAADPTNLFTLFGLIPWDPSQLPLIGSFLVIGIWPLIMGATMWVQMRLNPAPPDPTQAMIFNWMPIIFTFMLASFPAGLVIYWAWNNTLSVIQQTVIMRREGVKVDLWGNIAASFKRKPAAPAAEKPVNANEPAKAKGKSAKANAKG